MGLIKISNYVFSNEGLEILNDVFLNMDHVKFVQEHSDKPHFYNVVVVGGDVILTDSTGFAKLIGVE